jgi:hypothetical protein
MFVKEAAVPPPGTDRLITGVLGLQGNGAFRALRRLVGVLPREGMLIITFGAGEDIAAFFTMKSTFTTHFTSGSFRFIGAHESPFFDDYLS